MTLTDLKSLLTEHSERSFRLHLPDGGAVPISFHVTEVGRLHKTFLDCGGTLREITTCQLQVWVGPDFDHRIETRKLISILNKAKSILPDDEIPVEIEYEDRVISQYTISGHELVDDAILLRLAHKHTECLALDICCPPSLARLPAIGEKSPCCGPSGCC